MFAYSDPTGTGFLRADVIHAREAKLPEWARTGNEQMRMPIA
jgi:hypothetical protein